MTICPVARGGAACAAGAIPRMRMRSASAASAGRVRAIRMRVSAFNAKAGRLSPPRFRRSGKPRLAGRLGVVVVDHLDQLGRARGVGRLVPRGHLNLDREGTLVLPLVLEPRA